MRRIVYLIVAVFPLIASLSHTVSATEKRLRALEPFNVEKNSYLLRRTKSCPGCYLVNARLSGLNLRGANLKGANLVGATFRRSSLYGADLSGAKLSGADFSGALFTEGQVCLEGSIGECLFESSQEE